MLELVPFSTAAENIKIQVSLKREDNLLRISFVVLGETGRLSFSELTTNPVRKDGLWKQTCFEVFISPPGAESYWEMNFSPSGDWNAYQFERYRHGMKPEDLISISHPIKCKQEERRFTLETAVDVSRLKSKSSALMNGALDASATAVIQNRSGEISYWASHHAGGEPDFHLRKSFKAKLPV